MGRWLDALKKHENAGEGHRQNRQNPRQIGFGSFVGSVSGENAEIFGPAFHGVLVGLPEHAGRPLSEADFNLWVEFEERAAVLEFDGGHSRQDAEQLARMEVYGEGGDG